MHLLAATPGAVDDGSEAVDLGQTPGEIVFLTAADTEIACLAAAQERRVATGGEVPSLRVANLLHLKHPYSVDLYVEDIVSKAQLVIVRLLGGRSYWDYGVEQLTAACRTHGIPVVWLPGDDQPDADLQGFSTLPQEAAHRLWQYCIHGGITNAENLLAFASTLIGHAADFEEPAPLLRCGVYWPGKGEVSPEELPWKENGRPVAAVVFYRALSQAANTAVIDALVAALDGEGVNALPIYVTSLKDPVVAATMEELLTRFGAGVILNGTGFALSTPGGEKTPTPFDVTDAPVLQVVFSGGNEDGWRNNPNGLSARDIAMNVALPEVDGRILTRAVSFKGRARRHPLVEADIVEYQPVESRCRFAAAMAAKWLALGRKPERERRVALILANYPNRDGRLGNGVGLDTPAATVRVLEAMRAAGYDIPDIPGDGNALVEALRAGATNATVMGRVERESMAFSDYQIFFSTLPKAVRDAVMARWGAAEKDPFFAPGALDCGRFILPAMRLGKTVVAIQPARGYNIDPVKSYHDPDLVPPHGYIAFYAWLREQFRADAVIHMGKHGNLEWLPGKSVALDETCFPEAIFGPMAHLYPFIVNDPGEGTQAKRRTGAVIIDHLTPPLTRAESYGPLRDLELLVDEYYEAAGVDPRRLKVLKREILELAQRIGLDRDIGFDGMLDARGDEDRALAALDNYLCELKELQIRDGLHIFGCSPEGTQRTDLLVALARVPRNKGEGRDASLIRALAQDFGMDGFDPLNCDMGGEWTGPRPSELCTVSDDLWRSNGDTVERLEIYSTKLVMNEAGAPGKASGAVLEELRDRIAPMVDGSGAAEIEGLLKGLSARFVEPGPSGAPTRGRPDVLPTGRNFYSVDTRTVPTPAAWTLGWKSAQLLVEAYAQEHGRWPERMAISAWGTSNMRTGGDDLAQALALLGVRPTWDSASRRVTGFEILPLDLLDRPRVDVTLRISGFFRDAFPGLMDLFDSAVRAVAALDEGAEDNPLAASYRKEVAEAVAGGVAEADAMRDAGARLFGSKPGAYGAGLQALIDERGWETDADLAKAYVVWGGYAYGSGGKGRPAHDAFERRLGRVQAVVQNQDNREHDILDSDDYYQFEGGMTAAVRVLSGEQPEIYHNDHSRPETPRIRTLRDEIGRIVRARAANPKWIAGVMRHGYKGAFEMAATLDYLFAFAATARVVEDHHFDQLFEAYVADRDVRDFIADNNPDALREMMVRFQEAIDRGLWKPKRNDVGALMEGIGQ